jgi:hypothetical protein
MTLGYVRKLKDRLGKLDPPFVSPFTGYSIGDLCNMIETFPCKAIVHMSNRQCYSIRPVRLPPNPCTVRERMYKRIQPIRMEIDTVGFNDFDSRSGPGEI